MVVKVYTSDLTWRKVQDQCDILATVVPGWPDIPCYHGADDRPSLFRTTARKNPSDIYVSSIAIVARNECDLIEFLIQCDRSNSTLICVEEGYSWRSGTKGNAIKKWQRARKESAAKIGGRRSADVKKAVSAEAIAKIKDRWPLPSKEWPTKVLLKEADVSLNTVKSLLGKRPIAQYNYQAKMKRFKLKLSKEDWKDIANGRD